jgi:hypothetical protein
MSRVCPGHSLSAGLTASSIAPVLTIPQNSPPTSDSIMQQLSPTSVTTPPHKVPPHQQEGQKNCSARALLSPPSPTMPSHSREELSLAEESIKKLCAGSQFFPPRAANDDWFHGSPQDGGSSPALPAESGAPTQVATTHVRTLHEHEIRVEKLLGRGGFCEVRLAYLNNGTPSNVNVGGDQDDQPTSYRQEYAIKFLLPAISHTKSRKFCRGAADLAIEARFLSLLSHENIIRLHYVSAGSLHEIYHCLEWDGSITSCDSTDCNQKFNNNLRHNYGYFLVLEHLHETLDHRIRHSYIPEVTLMTGADPMKHHDNHCCTTYSHIMDHACQNRRWSASLPQWMQHKHSPFVSRNESLSNSMKSALARRLVILKSIATAVKYLHDHHIILRDIKPDNIGKLKYLSLISKVWNIM